MNRSEEWADYLDPAESDPPLSPADRELLERFSAALADEAVWTGPPADLRSRLLERAAAEPLTGPSAATSDGPPAATSDLPPAATSDLPSAATSDRPSTTATHGPGTPPPHGPDAAPATVTPLDPRRRSRRSRWIAAGGVAAAAVLVLVVAIAWPRPHLTTFAMSGTALAPQATATADLEPRSAGLAITLHVKGLPPAPPGTYYAAWLRGGQGDVPVGTFHWRKGGIPIELWSGVLADRYPELRVTLQREGDPPTPSNVLVLVGKAPGPTG